MFSLFCYHCVYLLSHSRFSIFAPIKFKSMQWTLNRVLFTSRWVECAKLNFKPARLEGQARYSAVSQPVSTNLQRDVIQIFSLFTLPPEPRGTDAPESTGLRSADNGVCHHDRHIWSTRTEKSDASGIWSLPTFELSRSPRSCERILFFAISSDIWKHINKSHLAQPSLRTNKEGRFQEDSALKYLFSNNISPQGWRAVIFSALSNAEYVCGYFHNLRASKTVDRRTLRC